MNAYLAIMLAEKVPLSIPWFHLATVLFSFYLEKGEFLLEKKKNVEKIKMKNYFKYHLFIQNLN